MRISRIQINNFRNFKSLDVKVGENLVLVGENNVGKSNFVHALRLVLDASLPESARRLRFEDFWDGAKPLDKDSKITIAIDLTDFEENENQFAILCDYSVAHSPMVARLTYAFFPKPDLDHMPTKESDYDYAVYGSGKPENLMSLDVRRRLHFVLLPALRDAEADLANWRRSPLRPLLDSLSAEIDDATKESLSDAVTLAIKSVAETDEVKALNESISKMLLTLVGKAHSVSTSLSFLATDTDRLIRTLKLFVDEGLRNVSEASLGSTNLIYVALKLLTLEMEIKEKVTDHGFLAIEEPEAHLHPHVQRRVFKAFLDTRSHLPDHINKKPKPDRTIVLTTHSPHIASVTPIDSLVFLRECDSTPNTIARSMIDSELVSSEIDDLERYLDVTRGEILFAKGVILVEGDAEQYLVPVLAKLMGYDLDEQGISVCSVSGTNFIPYVKLLHDKGLGIPFAIITDEDPKPDKNCLAHNRVSKIVELVDPDFDYPDESKSLFEEAESVGVFVTEYTLEVALFRSGRHKSITKALDQLSTNGEARKRAANWGNSTANLDEKQLLKDIDAIGKGRFAQRLSSRIKGSACPESIKKAIKFVHNRLNNVDP